MSTRDRTLQRNELSNKLMFDAQIQDYGSKLAYKCLNYSTKEKKWFIFKYI